METSQEEKLKASSSWKRANAHNSRVKLGLQKEICRLDRQFEREICQLKAAQNRFEQHYRRMSTPGKKSPLVLPPVKEMDISHEESNALLKVPKERSLSNSLTYLPPLPAESLYTSTLKGVTRARSISVDSVPRPKSDGAVAKDDTKRRASYDSRSVTRTRLQPL